MSDLSITSKFGDASSKAIDFVNQFRYKKQQSNVAAANPHWSPAMQNQLMGALNGSTTDAACGRTNQ